MPADDETEDNESWLNEPPSHEACEEEDLSRDLDILALLPKDKADELLSDEITAVASKSPLCL